MLNSLLGALEDFWPLFISAVTLLMSLATSVHAVMHKRDARSAITWVGLVWLAPVAGAVLYVILGINRIQRRGSSLRMPAAQAESAACAESDPECSRTALASNPNLAGLLRLVGDLTGRPLERGCRVTPLVGGEQAYPVMLEAIAGAERSIAFCSYIFDNDRAGREFLEALAAARERGVEVRVIIDAVGAKYSRPTMLSELASRGLRAEAFLPTRVPRLFHYSNLRNHRKILAIDGRVGFTGGMNVREGNRLDWNPSHPIHDVHFRIDGPVVSDLVEAFAVDWEFVAGERLGGEAWFPAIPPDGPVFARGIPDGPDEDFEKLPLTIQGALAAARSKVLLVTPYFFPDSATLSALRVAALRGVKVDIVLPRENNIKLVQWASATLYEFLLERGCRIYLSPPPFDHTKLFLVDGLWALLGSTNWDARSLRLNFEFNVECYSTELAGTLEGIVRSRIAASREVTLDAVRARSIPERLRDGAARLLSPYL